MSRALLAVIAALALLVGCLCPPLAGPGKVPEHTHKQTRDRQSCEDVCYPGVCDSAFGLKAQKQIACAAPVEALCVCRAPETAESE